MKKLVLISFLLLPTFAWAIEDDGLTEELRQRQIEQNINQLGQEISKNIKDAGKQLQVIIPAVTTNLNNIIDTFTTEVAPIIQAIEENSKLIAPSDSMAEALTQSLPPQYRQEIRYTIDSPNNELKISGKIIENKTTTDFTITRNLTAATITRSIMTEANRNKPDSTNLPDKILAEIENEKISLNNFNLETINQNPFMIYEDMPNKKTYIFGNLNPVLTLQAKSSGTEHSTRIREFVKNLNLSEINQAVSYDASAASPAQK